MSFEAPITVRQAIDRIHRREYVLPAIQREFVWKPEQIVGLFDSLLRGFPIGSLLFWKVEPERRGEYQFYNFLQNYHERDLRHNPKADLSGDGSVIATLDGQQRLTSLYIGLRGSYAVKKPYARRTNDAAFIPKRLYLNLDRGSDDNEMVYDLRFRPDTVDFLRDDQGGWMRAGKVLDFASLADVINFLRTNELLADQFPQDALTALHSNVNERPILSSYVETSQFLDKVLTIFIRVNSAGTELSYSDLILSIATAKWEELDAREEIHRIVDDINRVGDGFEFNKDFVLKTCLMLGEYETRFAAENFKAENMHKIEGIWPAISDAIRGTVRLLDAFGFSGETLPSLNAVIPITYYLFRARKPTSFYEASAFADDRERIRRWLAIALLKRAFTGQPDSALRAVRDVIRENHEHGFPADAIIKALRTSPRSMTFGEEELDGVLEGKFTNAYTFSTLALLYPDLDFRNAFHVDHIHPRSHFTKAQLARRGITDHEQAIEYQDRFDLIPNLQLLRGTENLEKSSKPFAEWIAGAYADPVVRRDYLRRHYVPENQDPSFSNFIEFYEERRNLMREGLKEVVGMV